MLLRLLGFPSCPSTFGVCACPLNWPPPGYPLPGYPVRVYPNWPVCSSALLAQPPLAKTCRRCSKYTSPAQNCAPNILLHRTLLQIYLHKTLLDCTCRKLYPNTVFPNLRSTICAAEPNSTLKTFSRHLSRLLLLQGIAPNCKSANI